MRIVILHYAAPPIIGGVERVIYYHATLLHEFGHDVRVVAGRGEPFAPGIAFHRLDLADSRHPEVLNVKAKLDRGEFPAESFEEIVARLLDSLHALVERADVLIAHNVLSLHKNLPLTAALRELVDLPDAPRFIAWHHDLAWRAARYEAEMHDGYPWDLLRKPWPNVRHVAVSKARKQDVAEVFDVAPADVAVVPGGIDSPAFLKLEPAIQELVYQGDLVDAIPLLLLPARITRRKNVELAIRVTAALRQQAFPSAALVVTGPPGPHNPDNLGYFDELQALCDELGVGASVHFLTEQMGRSPTEREITDLYHLADLLLFPSFEEGFGLPILEAGLLRLPIFCADIPALRELAGGYATLFSPNETPEKVATLIQMRLNGDPTLQLRRRAFEQYDWRHIVRQCVEPLLG